MMLGLPPDTHPRELVKIGRTVLSGSVPPNWSRPARSRRTSSRATISICWSSGAALEPGRRRPLHHTYGGVVTKDPDSGVMNVGIYRGMVGGKN